MFTHLVVSQAVLYIISSVIIPTVSRAIGPPNSYKYWWLRSPDTYGGSDAYYVRSDGDVDYGIDIVYYNSYGRFTFAEHEFILRLESPPLWHRLPRRLQRRQQFLRAHIISPNTYNSYSAYYVNSSGYVGDSIINVDYSYG